MENILRSPLIRRELSAYGMKDAAVELIRHKEGVIVARVNSGSGTAILKAFERDDFKREILNYGILGDCGIPTIKVLDKSADSLLLEDISASEGFRLGAESDLSDPEVIKALARWYRLLHDNGREYVRKNGAGMYSEWDLFTFENIEAVGEHFGLKENRGFRAVRDGFGLIDQKLRAMPMSLNYNDFYYTNLVVKKDKSEAMMFDYNLLGKGFNISDINNVTYWFSEENKALFISEYGGVDPSLDILDRICSPIISLQSAMSRGIFPEWAEEAIGKLEDIPRLISGL